jgi:Ca2+-binding EF-hand superfamily protein
MRKAAAAFLLAVPGMALSQADHREEFTALDLNGDGKVSLAEAAGHAAIVVRFDRADRNRDGKLTMAEFNRLKKLRIPVNETARKAFAARNAGVGASGRR